MKRPLAVIGLVLALAFPAYAVPTGRTSGTRHSSSSTTKPKVHVKGYYRKDGTYVAPHYRALAPKSALPIAIVQNGNRSCSRRIVGRG